MAAAETAAEAASRGVMASGREPSLADLPAVHTVMRAREQTRTPLGLAYACCWETHRGRQPGPPPDGQPIYKQQHSATRAGWAPHPQMAVARRAFQGSLPPTCSLFSQQLYHDVSITSRSMMPPSSLSTHSLFLLLDERCRRTFCLTLLTSQSVLKYQSHSLCRPDRVRVGRGIRVIY